jgi:hypothetical protein
VGAVTVRELIARLSALDPERTVLVGYDDCCECAVGRVVEDVRAVRRPWDGEGRPWYAVPDREGEPDPVVPVVTIWADQG